MVTNKNKTSKKKSAQNTSAGQIKVIQVRSGAGRTIDQQRTLVGLGLNKIRSTSILEDTPSVRGMVNKIRHLVKFEQI